MPNLFDAAAPAAAERFDTLLARPGVRIERIVSAGHASPPGFWYDQGWDEWVMVIEGAAVVEVAGAGERRLERGDHVLIAAGTRHRIAWTDPGRPTIWLAVHVGEPA